jgi:TPR repeat protein
MPGARFIPLAAGLYWTLAAIFGTGDAFAQAKPAKPHPQSISLWQVEILARGCLDVPPRETACSHPRLLDVSSGGRMSAQAVLAWMLAQGQGGATDFGRALSLYREMAELGDPASQNNLGELYESGRGTRADPAFALALYRKSAESGFPPAQFNLGRALVAGLAGPADFVAARPWLEKAEESGVRQARTLLDWMDRQPKR